MKKLTLLALTTLGLMGCDLNLHGNFLLQQPMPVVNAQGQNQILPAGRQEADIKIKDKKINVKMAALGTELVIKMTKDQRKSLEKGKDTLLPSSTSGQPFDVLAKIYSRTLDRRSYYQTQPCTRYVSRTVCSGSRCWTETIAIGGWQHVQVNEEDVQSYGNMKIFKTGTQELLSTAAAETAVRTVVYNSYAGMCY